MVRCPTGTIEQIKANTVSSRTASLDSSEDEVLYHNGEAGLENVYLAAELDIVRADKRCPPTTEDQITYMFINHFLDILLKSWDGKPCLKQKLAEQEECLDADVHPEDEDLCGEDGNRNFEQTSHFNMSVDYLNDLYKSRTQKLSKGNETPSEFGISAMCKKRCESKSTASDDAAYEVDGEETISESQPSWKTVAPDEEVEMSFQNGAWYNGRVSRRLMDGDGTFYWEDGSSFQGEFINGTATGFGKLQFPSLNVYEGTVYKGFRHGDGLHCMHNSPILYSGEWWLGKKSGNGIIFYDDPVRCLNFYKGSWANGKKDGFGCRQYPSGSRYIGFWQNGKRHGTGIMFWCNHDIYRGEWKNGLMDGFGEYIWNGFVNKTFSHPRLNTFIGFWESGKRNGVGLLELTNGSFIETVWVENEKNGPGAAICPNGYLVICNSNLFKNDKPALLNDEEEDSLGLLLRSQGFQINRKKDSRKGMPKLSDEDQLLSFMSSMEKAKAISIPIHTPVHSLDLGCHVKRFMDQKKVDKNMRNAAPRVNITTGKNLPDPRDMSLSAEFFSHEEKLLRYSIMINLMRIKECYEDWATAACSEKPPFQCTLLRIFFWEMLTQGEVPRRNLSLIDIDEILGQEESFMIDSPHDPFEKIQLWQFIHFLITISWYSYGQYVYAENVCSVSKSVQDFLDMFYSQNEKTVLAPAFRYFLHRHILDQCGSSPGRKFIKHKDLAPFEPMYMLYKKVGEPHSAKQFLRAVFKEEGPQSPYKSYYFEKVPQHKKLGQNAMSFTNNLSYFPTEEPFNYPQLYPFEKENEEMYIESNLTSFAELKPEGIVKCLVHVCPNIVEDDLIVDMEYQLTFLEFYKVIITCAETLLKKRSLKTIQSELISNYKKELEEYEKLMKEYEKQKEASTVVTKKLSFIKKTKK